MSTEDNKIPVIPLIIIGIIIVALGIGTMISVLFWALKVVAVVVLLFLLITFIRANTKKSV